MPRLLRITTVPISLHLLLQGQFRYMREHGFDVITMSADGKEVADVIKDGTLHIVIPLTRKITPLHDLKCLWKLVREIKKLKPDIVHTHTPKAGLLGMLAAWACNVPVRLHTVAGLPLMETNGLKRYVLEIAEKVTYACAQVVYPNSEGLKKFLQQQLDVSERKLRIIGKGSSNGINTAFFDRSPALEKHAQELRMDYQVKEGDIVFCFVGRIVRAKGIVELVKAFKQVTAEFDSTNNDVSKPKLLLLLVGHFEEDLDPLPTEVLEFIATSKNVILAGFQGDVRPFIMASDVFVFPSYREGFPNVVMQAALLGVPCIVSDIYGCNEIIRHYVSGIVVPSKDVVTLALAMKNLAGDDTARRNFAVAARSFVAAHFKQELVWEGLKEEYRRLIALKDLKPKD